ncbi:MAG TPA: DNA primase [Candidatus Portnoybacteria bacterium]|nr:DNA primase [Candidatus Portnoybacteria bacterium]
MLNSPVDEIKSRLDIVEVIQGYLKLQKTGANYRARCPFHNEKTPSFFVSPARQIWHCFGCDKGGDMFGFVMEIDGVEFVDALRMLAQKAGVELKREDPKLKSQRTRLFEICQWATKFFEKCLSQTEAGKKALVYLRKRGFSPETIKEFQVGYAPNSWDVLTKFLQSKGYSENEIDQAGLLIRRETGRVYDRFRGRIIFPIANLSGEVIGFGGRIFEGEKEDSAKYINSPQTLIYDKSKVLYGLDRAKTEIRKSNLCLIVEGYTDVLASHQAGLKNVLASSGTALTEEQIRIIKRYTENLATAFDMDLAGDSATKRGVNLAILAGLNVKVVEIPSGKDPADFIQKNPKDWPKMVSQAKSIVDFYFANTFSKFDSQKVEDKKQAAKILLPVIKKIPNKVEQAHWLQKLAHQLRVEEKVLVEAIKEVKIPQEEKFEAKKKERLKKSRVENLEERLLGLLLIYPEKIEQVINQKGSFTNPPFAKIFKQLKTSAGKEFDLKDFQKKLPSELSSQLDFLALKVEHDLDEDEDINLDQEIETCLRELESCGLKKELKQLGLDIKRAEDEKDKENLKILTGKFNQLSQELTRVSNS